MGMLHNRYMNNKRNNKFVESAHQRGILSVRVVVAVVVLFFLTQILPV